MIVSLGSTPQLTFVRCLNSDLNGMKVQLLSLSLSLSLSLFLSLSLAQPHLEEKRRREKKLQRQPFHGKKKWAREAKKKKIEIKVSEEE